MQFPSAPCYFSLLGPKILPDTPSSSLNVTGHVSHPLAITFCW